MASAAEVDREIYARFRQLLREQQREGRSLGSGDELRQALGTMVNHAAPGVLLRSAIEAIVAVLDAHVASWCPQKIDRYIVAGGGCKNIALVEALAQRSGVPVVLSDEYAGAQRLSRGHGDGSHGRLGCRWRTAFISHR